MPDSVVKPRVVRLSSGQSATLHTHTQAASGDLVLIEHRGARQLAIHLNGQYLAPSGRHTAEDCRVLGVLRIAR